MKIIATLITVLLLVLIFMAGCGDFEEINLPDDHVVHSDHYNNIYPEQANTAGISANHLPDSVSGAGEKFVHWLDQVVDDDPLDITFYESSISIIR